MSKKLPALTYNDIDLDFLRNKLKLKSFKEKANLIKKHPHAAKVIASGALASTLFLGSGNVSRLPPANTTNVNINNSAIAQSPQNVLLAELSAILPKKVTPLTTDQEKKVEFAFRDVINIPAKATLEGEHLNTTYGLIGAEQHLRRYPGDVMGATHPAVAKYDEGMAPGLGAWGYFAPSKNKLTPDLIEKEKWYAVVQTLYLPDWSKRLPYLRDWYKYRKVLIVNTLNGNAVVADVADSGPAKWTGKSFGGSPEVMNALGGAKYKVGPVILFFVDDPNNQIPLGPVYYNNI